MSDAAAVIAARCAGGLARGICTGGVQRQVAPIERRIFGGTRLVHLRIANAIVAIGRHSTGVFRTAIGLGTAYFQRIALGV